MAYTAIAFHDQLRKSPGLSDGAVRVALSLSGYADKEGRCWPSQRLLADDLDCSLRKVSRAMQELQSMGIIEYQTRARHRGERSTIQLKTGVTVGTGVKSVTGDKSVQEPVSNLSRTGVKSGAQNSPMNSSIEPPQYLTGATKAAPGVNEDSHNTGEIVAHAVTVAKDNGLTPPSAQWRGQLGKVAKERLDAGAALANLLLAVECLVLESKSPNTLEAVLRDIERGGGRRNGGYGTTHTNPRRGRSGKWR